MRRFAVSLLLLAPLCAQDLAPELQAKMEQASQHVRARQPDQAIALYSEVAAASPSVWQAFFERGKLYQSAKQHAKAIADYAAVAKLKPDHAEAHFRRCQVNMESSASAAAIADCSEAIKLNAKNGEYYYVRGLAHLGTKDLVKANGDLEYALAMAGEHPEALYYLGEVAALKDEPLKALRYYTVALQQRPGYADALRARARVKDSIGDTLGAKEDLALAK